MAKIKWQNKADIEDKQAERQAQKAKKEKLKGKDFKTLSTKEKDALLQILAEEHGLI